MTATTGPRAILYRRVSTDEQRLSLDAQSEQLQAEADRRGWQAEVVTDEDVSGAVPASERPALGPALDSLQPGDVLAVAKLDRLSRSVLDFAQILTRADAGGWGVVVLDLGVDMTSPSGRLVAQILAAVAEWERSMISVRTREGLSRSTRRLGRRPGLPAVGGARPATINAQTLAAVRDLREAGHSPARIAAKLTEHGHAGPRGGRWHPTSVRRLLARLDAEAA